MESAARRRRAGNLYARRLWQSRACVPRPRHLRRVRDAPYGARGPAGMVEPAARKRAGRRIYVGRRRLQRAWRQGRTRVD